MTASGQRRARRAAFTLIELLVVVAIIALLLSILLPSLQGARDQAKKAKCGVNLRSLGQGVIACQTENRDYGPSWDDGEGQPSPHVLYSWADVLFDLGYVGNDAAQRCPTDKRPDDVTRLRAEQLNYRYVDEFGRNETPKVGIRTSYAQNGVLHFNFPEDRNKDASRQIYATDGLWTWLSSINAWIVVATNTGYTPNSVADVPRKGANGVAWRHGSRFESNFLFRDGHVSGFTPTLRVSLQEAAMKTFDTAQAFTWRAGEGSVRTMGNYFADGIPSDVLNQFPAPWRPTSPTTADNFPYATVAHSGNSVKWIGAQGPVLGDNRNFHPFGYPEELSALWRTKNRVWKELPANPANRK